MNEIARHVFVALPLAALLVAAPVPLNGGKLISYDAAYAAAGGNGKGSGNGATNGSGSANNSASANNGSSQGNKNGIDNGNNQIDVANNDPNSNNGNNDLGRLNAFLNASPNALKNASPKSAIGIISVQYRDALTAYLDGTTPDFTDAAAILAKAANKPLTQDIVSAINARLAAENPDNLSLAGLVDPAAQATSDQLASDLSSGANVVQQTEANQGLGPIY